ncbi:nickel pincer cofactor biosynthesis protein LarC [Candidatus Chlorohelix sp.]|uniref:nickel pincer cofactor biosynthesis protein LarC n=1 Tax=Candidatus Chlorohelix sp. TaxID=3139201 RepID=UPI003023E21E
MSKLIYFDAFSGVSGDMTLGALLHAGMPLDYLKAELAKLGIANYRIEMNRVEQHSISGIKLDVILEQPELETHRHLGEILAIIENSALAGRVKDRASRIFRALGEAEAHVHGVPLEQVHFHEVGAVDAIVDIVGACIGFEYFEVAHFYCSALPLGSGFVNTAHGILPVPAPATLQLLANSGAILSPQLTLRNGSQYPARSEMVTPTGAAIISTLCRFTQPAMQLEKIGYGFGSREFDWLNALRLWLGESLPESEAHKHRKILAEQMQDSSSFEHDEICGLETNLDDMSAEGLGYLMGNLLAEGALDVYFSPIQMKKNRPGVMLGVLINTADEARIAELILKETSAFGLRVSQYRRYKAGRNFREVEVSGAKVRLKLKFLNEVEVEAVPEYEDVATIARRTGRPFREIYEAAKTAPEIKNPPSA